MVSLSVLRNVIFQIHVPGKIVYASRSSGPLGTSSGGIPSEGVLSIAKLPAKCVSSPTSYADVVAKMVTNSSKHKRRKRQRVLQNANTAGFIPVSADVPK